MNHFLDLLVRFPDRTDLVYRNDLIPDVTNQISSFCWTTVAVVRGAPSVETGGIVFSLPTETKQQSSGQYG